MAPRTRLNVLLLLLGLTTAGALYYVAAPAPGQPAAGRVADPAAPSAEPPPSAPAAGFPGLNLDSLALARPEPLPAGRNPFRLEDPKPVARTAVEPLMPTPPRGPVAAADTSPAQAAFRPIPLKFIGLVNQASGAGRIAVLSDGRFVHHGREGDLVDGRYRIVRIGEESIELEHVDGRSRQTLRLSGS